MSSCGPARDPRAEARGSAGEIVATQVRLGPRELVVAKPGFAGLASGLGREVLAQLGVRSCRCRNMTQVRLIQRHSHNLLLVHVVWATAGRVAVLPQAADAWLAEVLRGKACDVGCRLVACGSASEHVHVLLRYPSTVRLADAVHRLKGGSSHDWNASRRRPRLSWQPGYWAESFGPAELPTLVRYVERQRTHHGDALAPEPWETTLSAASHERPDLDCFSSR